MLGFLIDENLPATLAEKLVSHGFKAQAVADSESLRSATDADLMVYAQLHGLVVVSKDKDFADVSKYPLGSHAGVVCVRLPSRMTIEEQIEIVGDFIAR